MDILIRLAEIGSNKETFVFPSNPESISGTMGAKYQSFDIISKGTIKVPKGMNITEIKWDGEFFGQAKKNESVVLKAYYQEPNQCMAQLLEWQEKGTILNLIVTDTWINMDVTISSFAPQVYGAYGNVKYSISFTQAKDLKIYTTNELQIASFVKKTVPRNDSAGNDGSSYIVVSGDTLWDIALKKLGSGTAWTKIYDANADTIEAEAQSRGGSSDHGHWIYPGTVLFIPSA